MRLRQSGRDSRRGAPRFEPSRLSAVETLRKKINFGGSFLTVSAWPREVGGKLAIRMTARIIETCKEARFRLAIALRPPVTYSYTAIPARAARRDRVTRLPRAETRFLR